MSIIILTNKTINNLPNYEDLIVINKPIKLVDEFHLEYNNKIIEFDYLLVENQSFLTNYNILPFMLDDDVIITNWSGQTTIEHIYIGNLENAIDELFNY